MNQFTPQLGQTYYSVGPLQNHNNVEQWKFTGDQYDSTRIAYNNCFQTIGLAQQARDYCKLFNIKD